MLFALCDFRDYETSLVKKTDSTCSGDPEGPIDPGEYRPPYGLRRGPVSESGRVFFKGDSDDPDSGKDLYTELRFLCGGARGASSPR